MKTWMGIVCACVLGVSGSFGEKPKAGPRRMDAATRARFMERAGGMVTQRAASPGFVFLNAQGRVPAGELAVVPQTLENILQYTFLLESGKAAEPLRDLPTLLTDKRRAAVVGLCDVPGLPTLLVAPEARWAVVNVGALAADGATGAVLASRVRKEMWRSFTLLMGAANSVRPECLMRSVFSLADLDEGKAETVCPEPFSKILAHAEKLGMRHNRTTTYRKACEEGWAPPPANEAQRKIRAELSGAKK